MSKQPSGKTKSGPLGSLLTVTLIIVGMAVVGWGTITLFSDRSDALSQFVLSTLLGGGLIAIGLFMLRSHLAQRNKVTWLDKHGTSITAVPVEVRTIKTDSVRRAESYCLILEPIEMDKERYGLDGVKFETDEIFARSVPDKYQDLKIEVVIDPKRPNELYIVNFDAQDLWNAARQI